MSLVWLHLQVWVRTPTTNLTCFACTIAFHSRASTMCANSGTHHALLSAPHTSHMRPEAWFECLFRRCLMVRSSSSRSLKPPAQAACSSRPLNLKPPAQAARSSRSIKPPAQAAARSSRRSLIQAARSNRAQAAPRSSCSLKLELLAQARLAQAARSSPLARCPLVLVCRCRYCVCAHRTARRAACSGAHSGAHSEL